MPKDTSEDTILGLIAKERYENSSPEDYISFEEAVAKLGLKI
jgi:hypothetical protein